MRKAKPEENLDDKIVLNLRNKIVTLKAVQFDTDVDMDDILKIDYANILGEVLTFPVILNRIGLMRADVEASVSNAKFDLEIYGAKLSEMYRKNLTTVKPGDGATTKLSKPTKDEVDNSVLLDEGYQIRKRNLIGFEKNRQYIESLYWAAREKSTKLDYCSNGIKPTDFENEILEGTVNGVLIKCHKKLIN